MIGGVVLIVGAVCYLVMLAIFLLAMISNR